MNNSSLQYFVFIESNTTGTGRLFLKEVIKKGYIPLFLTASPEKYPFLIEEAVQPVIIDTKDKDALLKFLQNATDIIAVFSCSEYYIATAAYLATALNLPANPVSSIENCRNKAALIQILKSHAFNVPTTMVINDFITAQNDLAKISFPAIVKPAYGTGSIGVKVCYALSEALAHINYLLTDNNLYNNENNAMHRQVLVQEYIEGQEYSAETLGYAKVVKLIGVTKKYTGSLPHFLEIGHDFPAPNIESYMEIIENTAIKALEILQLTLGASHIEFKIKENKIYFIEINPRLAGGMIPVLIYKSINVDLISLIIDTYIGHIPKLPSNLAKLFSVIRFILPSHDGVITKITANFSNLNFPIIHGFFKNINDEIKIQNDFRDRIGYVIVTNESYERCMSQAVLALKSIEVEIEHNKLDKLANTGRLQENLHPIAYAILNLPSFVFDSLQELNLQAPIDKAHIKMLVAANMLDHAHGEVILNEIKRLQANNFQEVLSLTNARGTYLLYENYLINKLGINIAGALHTARSRNDINATIFRMYLRSIYIKIYKTLWDLRSQIIVLAAKYRTTPFPIYSQYQTALPGILAHYLLAINEALSRNQESLQHLYKLLATCPLGAGGGGGTTFKINQYFVAELLGFETICENSLDAVASRDLALKFLGCINILAITVSRVAEDLQLWSTREFDFINFPDNLCGGSSMMPQKKNPYLLEKIKSMCSGILGTYVTSSVSMYKVPFANSVEINSDIIKNIDQAGHGIFKAIGLLALHLKNANINQDKINNALINNYTYATYITELLVKHGVYPFREAHHMVGKIIAEHINNKTDPWFELTALIKTLDLKLDPLSWAKSMRHGGGPGACDVQTFNAIKQLNIDGIYYRNLVNKFTLPI